MASEPGVLELVKYPNGLSVKSGAQTFFFPFKIIQFMTLKREGTAEAPTWTLHIRTATDKINLQSSRSLDEDFKAICMHFH
jgi:hypothetical protein